MYLHHRAPVLLNLGPRAGRSVVLVAHPLIASTKTPLECFKPVRVRVHPLSPFVRPYYCCEDDPLDLPRWSH